MFDAAVGKDEHGFVLITVMVVLVLLMGLALAASSGSILEIRISHNNQEYTQRLYQAEGGAKEIAAVLDTIPDRYGGHPDDMDKAAQGAFIQNPPNSNSDPNTLSTLADITGIWGAVSPDSPAPFFDPPPSDTKALKNMLKYAVEIKAMAISWGTAGGIGDDKASTLNMDNSSRAGQVYRYEIVSQVRKPGSTPSPAVTVSIGYKKKFEP